MSKKQPRKEKSVVVICVEGENVTEKQYLKRYRTREKCNIKFCPGNETDINGMLDNLIKYIKNNNFSHERYGDSFYLIVDLDNDVKKIQEIEKIKSKCKKHKINIITSNPTIELWFLLHYKYTTKPLNNNEVINELRKHLPNYEKSFDASVELMRQYETAKNNCLKLGAYNSGNEYSNPNTNFYLLIDDLIERNE